MLPGVNQSFHDCCYLFWTKEETKKIKVKRIKSRKFKDRSLQYSYFWCHLLYVLLTNIEHFLSKEPKNVLIHCSFPCPTKGLFIGWSRFSHFSWQHDVNFLSISTIESTPKPKNFTCINEGTSDLVCTGRGPSLTGAEILIIPGKSLISDEHIWKVIHNINNTRVLITNKWPS